MVLDDLTDKKISSENFEMLLALDNKLSGKPTNFPTYCQLTCQKEFDKSESGSCNHCQEGNMFNDSVKQPCGCSTCSNCLKKMFSLDQIE